MEGSHRWRGAPVPRASFPNVRRRLLIPLLVAVACALLPALASGAEKQRCNNMRILCERTFDEVVLPGTHNAMSSESLGYEFPNQSVGIPEQLDGGIRALLIDTHYGRLQPDGTVRTDDDGKITEGVRGTYLCHVLCEIGATKLAPALREIRKWLRANPDNVLLIENEDYISSEDFASAMRRSGLLDHVYRGSRAPWKTLEQMIAKRHQVVMLADRNSRGDPSWYRPTYEGLMEETPYTFNPPSKLTDPENWPESCQPNRGGTDGSLFLMNHWSPSRPPAEPNLEQSAQVNAFDVIVGRAKKCARIRGRIPTLVAVDQFTAGDVIAAVRELNRIKPKADRR